MTCHYCSVLTYILSYRMIWDLYKSLTSFVCRFFVWTGIVPVLAFHDYITHTHGIQISRIPLHWRHNEHDGVSNHQRLDCVLNHLCRHRSKKTSKLCFTGLCEVNSLVTWEFPAQRLSNLKKIFPFNEIMLGVDVASLIEIYLWLWSVPI